MTITSTTDHDIIQALTGDAKTRNDALRHVFEKLDWKGAAVAYIVQNGGDTADAQAIAVDALVFFDRNIRNGMFDGRSSLKTYYMGIVKRQWWKHLDRRKTFDEFDPQRHDQPEANAEDYILSKEKMDFLKLATAVLGEKCKKLFMMKQQNLSSEDMAEELGFKNGAMAKKALYRCRQSFREYLQKNPQWREHLS